MLRKGVSPRQNFGLFSSTVLVSALGYFVDVYDIMIFSIVRIPSLTSLGLSDSKLFETGVSIQNSQLIGMLIGGLFAGILGDKFGRRSILFFSIVLYSLANLANGFVQTVDQYIILRFLAGLGLAGEVGVAVTLVSEVMGSQTRGYGTTLIATTGLLGAVVAAFVGKVLPWHLAYILGGILGLLLLTLRVATIESRIFLSTREMIARRGDFRMILLKPKRLGKYLICILVGLPVWFTSTILVPFSPELASSLDVQGTFTVSDIVILSFGGAALGDILAGIISQRFHNRKKVIMGFLLCNAALVFTILKSEGLPLPAFYILYFLLGVSSGFFAIFLTVTAELFGTNLRATVTTSIPNFTRGLVVPITLAIRGSQDLFGLRESLILIGAAVLSSALLSALLTEETYGKSLDFIED